MKNFLKKIQWDIVISGMILFTTLSLLGGGTLFLPRLYYKYFKRTDEETSIVFPEPDEISEENIKSAKGEADTILKQTEGIKRVVLYENPLTTPSYVSNSARLTDYLEQNTAEILIEGVIDSAYLYVASDGLDIKQESIYFWIVDGKGEGGHLVPGESLSSGSKSEFLYDLRKLPLIQRPYFPDKPPKHADIISEYLNKDISYKQQRQYYVGVFVSTTLLPNEITDFEIRYRCELGSECIIYTQ